MQIKMLGFSQKINIKRYNPHWLLMAKTFFFLIFVINLLVILFPKSLSFFMSKSSMMPPPRCLPRKHIMFLKTLKTGSSSLQNLLLRYAEKSNLTVAIPRNNAITFRYNQPFSLKSVEKYGEKNSSYDMIAHHLKFNARLVKQVLKHNNTFYFTILRHPVAQMESAFSFFRNFSPAFKASKSLEDFLDHNKKYYRENIPNNVVAKNTYWYTFGRPNCDECSEVEKERNLKEIEKTFHLVLISEYFDESLIMLKEALCWDLDDVITFKLNSRNTRVVKTINQTTADKILEWNSLDWMLYRHFNNSFWNRLDSEIGMVRLKQEVAELRRRRMVLEQKCSQDGLVEMKNKKDLFYKKEVPLMVHKVNTNLSMEEQERCYRFFMHPLIYTKILFKKQYST